MKIIKDPYSCEYVAIDVDTVWRSWNALSEARSLQRDLGAEFLKHRTHIKHIR